MNRKKTAFLAVGMMVIVMSACGGTSEKDDEASRNFAQGLTEALNSPETEEPGIDDQNSTTDRLIRTENADVENGNLSEELFARDVTAGNSANNLFNSLGAGASNSGPICFGNGRVYFVLEQDSHYSLCSFSLDGSDYICHGEVGSFTGDRSSIFNQYSLDKMNYDDGYIYYLQAESVRDSEADTYVDRVSVRRIFPDTGVDEKVVVFGEENILSSASTIRILNDDLFYVLKKDKEGSEADAIYEAGVVNLNTKEQRFWEVEGAWPSVTPVVDTDGTYIYYYIPSNQLISVNWILWEDVYREDAALTKIDGRIDTSGDIKFADNGFYTMRLPSEQPMDYIYYDYNEIASDGTWPEKVILSDVSYDYGNTEEELIDNLTRVHSGYVVDGTVLAFAPQFNAFYYSDTLDYHQAKNVGSLDDVDRRDTILYGEYDGSLYVIYGQEDSYTLHSLDKTGTCH